MTKDYFPHLTKEVVKTLGKNSNLISNDALNKKWKLLTLFKIEKTILKFNGPKLKPLELTLDDITDERNCLGSKKDVLVKDFQNLKHYKISIEAGGGVEPVEAKAKASTGSVDAGSPLTLMSDIIDQQDLSDVIMGDKKIKLKPGVKAKLDLQKGERLAFVRQIVYNTEDVKVASMTSISWSLNAKIYSKITGGSKGGETEVTTFTVPKETMFAYALKKITLKDDYLEMHSQLMRRVKVIREEIIPNPPDWRPDQDVPPPLAQWELEIGTSDPRDPMQDSAGNMISTVPMKCPPKESIIRSVVNDIKYGAKVLEALADVPGSTRMDLLETLSEILEDREALSLLEDSLDQYRHGKHQRPQSEAAASFMDLLDVSKASADFTEAVHMLVCALQGLPDNTAALLAKSGSETLNCLIQLIDGVQESQAKLPESPPPPLQENGELHWVAMFLIAANDLEDLQNNWDDPEISPEGLMELLYISVDGLSRMQAGLSS